MLSRVLAPPPNSNWPKRAVCWPNLSDTLARPANDHDARALRTAIAQLDDFFLLVVVGEFNAGKSAFINALVGERLLDEGVTPTTAQIHLLRYRRPVPRPSCRRPASASSRRRVDLLRDIHIVDTPGTNAIIREHEQLTTEFVPRSDLVLFVTSADRPFTETERAFLETIRDWGKKIVLVVNKVDIFEQPEELEQVVAFVRDAATRLLGVTPEIFPVSARLAWRAKHGEPSALGGEPLRGARALHPRHARRAAAASGSSSRTRSASATRLRGAIATSPTNGWRCSPTTSQRSTTSSDSSPAIARTWRAASSCA